MTFKDLENWQKNLVVKGLNDDENIYIEYTKDDIIASFKQENQKLKKQQKEFIEYLEAEEKRLVKCRETSPIYEDKYFNKRYVTQDVFEEVIHILSKYKEIIGGDNK